VLNLAAPDYGDAVELREGEVPVFWACGVTPQAALAAAKLPLAVTHAPGHMLVTDIEEAALAEVRVWGGGVDPAPLSSTFGGLACSASHGGDY
jgi:hypothetical protein